MTSQLDEAIEAGAKAFIAVELAQSEDLAKAQENLWPVYAGTAREIILAALPHIRGMIATEIVDHFMPQGDGVENKSQWDVVEEAAALAAGEIGSSSD